jgi:NTP pyrophosphatase (non-canonical NTP hydrolase)
MPAAPHDWSAMRAAVQAFHDKHDFKSRGGEELLYRVALMSEELGEISECITKGKGRDALSEECADLLILLIGTAISADLDLNASFWSKMDELMERDARMVDGRVRVSRFHDG